MIEAHKQMTFTDRGRNSPLARKSAMRLGISSYTYGWGVGVDGNRPPSALAALDLVERAAALEVGVLQLCDNLPPSTFEEPELEKIHAAARERRVVLELGTRGLWPEHLRRFIELAKQVGSPILRLVIDRPDDEPDEQEVTRRLAAVLPALEANHVVLAIENHDRFTSAALVRLIRSMSSSHIGICLDTVNSFGALEGPEVVVETLGPYVVNLHLKDFVVVRHPSLQGFSIEGRPAGTGRLNIPWLLRRLTDFGRDPNAILELWTPPELTTDETIDKERAWAQQSVRNVRQWING